jgi:hypothetical protein
MHTIKGFNGQNRSRVGLRSFASAAVAVAMGVIGFASPQITFAQSTTSAIFGHAPAGEIVTAASSGGLHRHATVNKQGRYKIGPLPVGDYTVTLEKDGNVVGTHPPISLLVGQNAQVDFACPNDQCAAAP